jgi:hypothetical protein
MDNCLQDCIASYAGSGRPFGEAERICLFRCDSRCRGR